MGRVIEASEVRQPFDTKSRISELEGQELLDLRVQRIFTLRLMDKEKAGQRNKPIARFVAAARDKLKMTGEKFGERFGTGKANVAAWEAGLHEPSYGILLAISVAADLPLPGVDKDGKTIRTPPAILLRDDVAFLLEGLTEDQLALSMSILEVVKQHAPIASLTPKRPRATREDAAYAGLVGASDGKSSNAKKKRKPRSP